MRKIMAVLVFAALSIGTCVAQDKAVMATVHQFIDGFNKGDTKSALEACAQSTYIIDEFPPHEWHGSGACGQWATDFAADAKKNGITDGRVTLGTPKHVDVAGDRAYVVVPAEYTFKMKGKPMKETGSVFTLALQKGSSGWKITAWSWAKG